MDLSSFWQGVEGLFSLLVDGQAGHLNENLRARLLPGCQDQIREPRSQLADGQGQEWMLEDILAMHLRLNTRMTMPILQQLAASTYAYCSTLSATDSLNLGHVPTLAVMQRFHQEALKRGWQELVNRMGVKAVSWPETPGLAPSVSEDQRQQRQLQDQEKRRSEFLKGPLLPYAEMMLGVVPVWRSTYPERGGAVWNETVLLAVGGALALRHHEHIMVVAEQHRSLLEGIIEQELAKPLLELRFQSLAQDPEEISYRALALCQKRAPDLVWNRLLKEL